MLKERDYFACMAMQALLPRIGQVAGYNEKALVKDAYTIADLMILESKK